MITVALVRGDNPQRVALQQHKNVTFLMPFVEPTRLAHA